MTTHTMNSPVGAFGIAAGSRGTTGGLFARLRARIDEHARFVRTREELATLTDRELEDIGLVRADIEDVARRAARVA